MSVHDLRSVLSDAKGASVGHRAYIRTPWDRITLSVAMHTRPHGLGGPRVHTESYTGLSASGSPLLS